MPIKTLLLFALCAFAEDKPVPKPQIPAEHQAEYWRTQALLMQAQTALRAAQEEAQGAVAQLTKDCGDKAGPASDPANPKLLACVPRPKPEEK
jgi:outer membrane protein TolC